MQKHKHVDSQQQRTKHTQNSRFSSAKNYSHTSQVKQILHASRPTKLSQTSETEADNISRSIPKNNDSSLSRYSKKKYNQNKSAAHSNALPSKVRQHYEDYFSADLSQVQIHHDKEAAQITEKHHADALVYTNHIFFNQNKFAPDTQTGHQLLTHELSHVLQQSSAPYQHGSPVQTTAAASIQCYEKKPAITPHVSLKFSSLTNNAPVSDPTKRNHGITIERRGDDLYYHIPQKGERKVPRPIDTTKKSMPQLPINEITWDTRNPIVQTAFNVSYGAVGSFSLETFRVNFFGEGKLSTVLDMIGRKPGSLSTKSDGLQIEQPDRNIIQPIRPSKFNKAVRYHFPNAPYSLYLEPNRTISVIDDTKHTQLWKLSGAYLVDFSIQPDGKTRITWNDPVGIVSVDIDISRPYFNVDALGALKTSIDRKNLLAWLGTKGIKVKEEGARFSDNELNAAKQTLESWKNSGDIIKALKANGAAGLTMVKSPLITGGSWNDTTGVLKIAADVKRNIQEENNTVIHEMTHALFTASALTLKKGVKAPAHVTKQATDLFDDSDANVIDEGVVSHRKPRTPRNKKQWEKALSTNADINKIWAELHYRYKIPDSEGTKDIRGLDVADESRYQQTDRGDPVGHAFDNVNEFIASFVTSSKQYQPQMTALIKQSKDTTLAGHYKKLWDWVNNNFVQLGSKNPYENIFTP